MRIKIIYLVLMAPLLPVAALCWAFEKVNKSKFLSKWESAAHDISRRLGSKS